MKFFFLFILVLGQIYIFSNDKTHVYAKNSECMACHPKIYDEYMQSQHQKSTIYKDPIHAAVWKKHPKNIKKEQYGCGKCHTPAADNLDDMLLKGRKALPDMKNTSHNEGISCAYCHRIKSIELHDKTNTNIIDAKEKHYYGTLRSKMGSSYHEISTEDNGHMQNGNVCVGCHSHKKNKFDLNVCSTNIDNEMDGTNCVSCHMPQVKGSVSSLNETKTHSFHGYPGTHSHSNMLTKYIIVSMTQRTNDFQITIENQTSHALLLHPLRMAVLNVSVNRDGELKIFEPEVFVRIIGKNGKPAMPWVANVELKNTMIKHDEKRTLSYPYTLQKGDEIMVSLGYYLVNPKLVKKLKLLEDKETTTFNILKKESFIVQ